MRPVKSTLQMNKPPDKADSETDKSNNNKHFDESITRDSANKRGYPSNSRSYNGCHIGRQGGNRDRRRARSKTSFTQNL